MLSLRAVPVRTVGEQSYRIRELQLRLHYASSLFQPAPEARLQPVELVPLFVQPPV